MTSEVETELERAVQPQSKIHYIEKARSLVEKDNSLPPGPRLILDRQIHWYSVHAFRQTMEQTPVQRHLDLSWRLRPHTERAIMVWKWKIGVNKTGLLETKT